MLDALSTASCWLYNHRLIAVVLYLLLCVWFIYQLHLLPLGANSTFRTLWALHKPALLLGIPGLVSSIAALVSIGDREVPVPSPPLQVCMLASIGLFLVFGAIRLRHYQRLRRERNSVRTAAPYGC